MRAHLLLAAACLSFTLPASAAQMPSRRAGLWELSMSFAGHHSPMGDIKQCIDAATDNEMMNNAGRSGPQKCSQRHISRSGDTITVDSVCHTGGATVTSHSVITGDFNSAYTMQVTSKREGGPPVPYARGGVTHITINAKWLGPCGKGQRPGDMIMPGGFKVNIHDLAHMRRGGPPRP